MHVRRSVVNATRLQRHNVNVSLKLCALFSFSTHKNEIPTPEINRGGDVCVRASRQAAADNGGVDHDGFVALRVAFEANAEVLAAALLRHVVRPPPPPPS